MPTTQQVFNGIRRASEQSLFFFSRAVLGLKFLTPQLHASMCNFLQDPLHHDKMMLVPRDHVKTTLVKALCLHVLIQDEKTNPYFPGIPGTDVRLILAGETMKNASPHLRSIEATLEKNTLLRTLWPHLQPGSKWSEHEMELVRNTSYSEPTIEVLGTDTAIASRHVDWIFEDDIFTFEAAMSPTVAERVRLWDKSLEAILDDTENVQARNTITGTPWSALDIYKDKIDEAREASARGEEPAYDIYIRSVIENQQPIWPERFPLTRLKRIEQRLRGTGLWQLNYMCDYESSELIDLRPAWLQEFKLVGNVIRIAA
jgi:hypothetical protein